MPEIGWSAGRVPGWQETRDEGQVIRILILGLFTGFAAFAGGSLNLLYLLAGSAGINPIMLILSLFLLMAWKVAGYYGLDSILLLPMTKRLYRQSGNKVSRLSVPTIALQQPAPALSIEETHGFE